MDKPRLSDREAAIVEAARREIAGRTSQTRRPEATAASASRSDSRIPPAAREDTSTPDTAARIAALIRAEQKEYSRRRKKLRQFGTVIPALILTAAVLWVVTTLFRYLRM